MNELQSSGIKKHNRNSVSEYSMCLSAFMAKNYEVFIVFDVVINSWTGGVDIIGPEFFAEWAGREPDQKMVAEIGRRFCALNADDDLQKANVYVMYPMYRKYSVVTASDLGALFMGANSAVKRVSGGKVRVRPDTTSDTAVDGVAVPRLSLEGIEEVSTPEFRHRMSMSRSRKPLLSTIDEEPVRSR
ncbi:hypothetical protein GH714_032660 [Hevea brasiliensis]|uniref:Uncharacterized protein n=1 Tax=Hevea brasiliensis TaxID=3981 RepID=A0A6A6L1Z6_HEVBR|nr:hypothetical protein GH714_032660 [Hevea brasiliensis]